MKFVIAIAMIAAGYTIFYYGMVLFRRYDPNTTTITDGVPLYVLFGFPSDAKNRDEMNAASPQPPFRK